MLDDMIAGIDVVPRDRSDNNHPALALHQA